MALTRNADNLNRLNDFTPEIEEIGNQFSLITDLGLFQNYNIESTAIQFDRVETESVLIPQSNRGQGGVVKGKDNRVGTYTLNTSFHKHEDGYSKDDILNYRKPTTAQDMEDREGVRLEKFTKLRRDMDLTHEFMRLSALTGVSTDGYGNTIADMFTEFNVTRPEVDFELGTNTTDVSTKIRQMVRQASANAKMNGIMAKPFVLCGDEFFDKLTSHADIKERYKYYLNSGKQRLRESLEDIRDWGSLGIFEDRDVTFINYSPSFQLLDGSTVQVIPTDEGTVVVPGSDMYHGYFAPSDRLGDTVGQEMFAFEDEREKGRGWDLEVQSSSLFINRKPLTAIKLTTSN